MKYETVKNYYNGSFHESSSTENLDVVSPIDGNLFWLVEREAAGLMN